MGDPTDFNDATETGFYRYSESALHNAKSVATGNGNMLVINCGTFIHQIVFLFNNYIVMRRYNFVSWNEWKVFRAS